MQNTFSTNFWCVFMPLPDLQVYFVNRVLNPQHAQISKAISIAQFILSDFPHESLRSCLLEFSYLSLFARYDAVPVFPLNTGSVNSDTPAETACAHLVHLKMCLKKELLLAPSVISIAPLHLSAHWSWAGCYQSTEANHQHLVWLSQADLWYDRPRLSLLLWQRRDIVAPTPIKIDMEAIVRSSALLISNHRMRYYRCLAKCDL